MSDDDPEFPRAPRGASRHRPSPSGRVQATGVARGRTAGSFTVSVTDGRGRPLRVPGLVRWLQRVAPARTRGEVAIALVGDARMRALNRDFRGKDHATDVLSFPSGDGPTGAAAEGRRRAHGGPEPGGLGDIVIARGLAARQAREAGHSLGTELRVLALHGLLHLLGHDHETDAGEMARLERRLRRAGGLEEGLSERERPR